MISEFTSNGQVEVQHGLIPEETFPSDAGGPRAMTLRSHAAPEVFEKGLSRPRPAILIRSHICRPRRTVPSRSITSKSESLGVGSTGGRLRPALTEVSRDVYAAYDVLGAAHSGITRKGAT